METSRRKFLKKSATLPLFNRIFKNRTYTEDDLGIGIYVTKKAIEEHGVENANNIRRVVENVFNDVYSDKKLHITYETTVDWGSRDRTYHKRALESWADMNYNPDYNSNLLIFSRENTSWGPYGGRGGSKYAVCTGYNILNRHTRKKTVLHEIGHTLGLIHSYGEVENGNASIMLPNGRYRSNSLEFSDESLSYLQEGPRGERECLTDNLCDNARGPDN